MKPRTCEYDEGQQAAQRFDSTVRKLLAVPHSEIQRREAEYRKQSALNPNRRGPKPKLKKRKASLASDHA